jgi:hypothetical protein
MAEKINLAQIWLGITQEIRDEMKAFLASRMPGASTATAMELGLCYGLYRLVQAFAALEPEDWDAVSENLAGPPKAVAEQLIQLLPTSDD